MGLGSQFVESSSLDTFEVSPEEQLRRHAAREARVARGETVPAAAAGAGAGPHH